MNNTKIDWCDATINPVVGCKRGCKYCYAEKMHKRFAKKLGLNPDFKVIQFLPERLKALESKKPKSIFMDSMSDIEYWDFEIWKGVYETMLINSQHNYIFLTKGGQEAAAKYQATELTDTPFFYTPPNVFFGKTIIQGAYEENAHTRMNIFLSIEPLLAPVILSLRQEKSVLQQIIIGAETGNRKGKVIPQKEWIDDLVRQADAHGIHVFMKESLRSLMGADFRQDTLIWQINKKEMEK